MSELQLSTPPAPASSVPAQEVTSPPPPAEGRASGRKEDPVYAAVTEVVRAVSDMTKLLQQTSVEQYVDFVKVRFKRPLQLTFFVHQ